LSENQVWKTVGKVKDAHGLKGELYILIFSGETSWLKKLKIFRLESTVFEVESVKAFKQGLILKPSKINDRNQSEELKGHSFSIPEELLISQKGETIFLSEIMGFDVFDGNRKIGRVAGTYMNGGHDLLTVELSGGAPDIVKAVTVDIPYVASYIEKIHWDEKKISMILPEGLIELQVESDS
jgi:16S rRNA processing protein RimM